MIQIDKSKEVQGFIAKAKCGYLCIRSEPCVDLIASSWT